MVVYFVLLGFICTVWFFNIFFKIKAEQARFCFLLTSFLVLVFVSGLRDFSVGTDTKTYVSVFQNKNYWQFEPAFAILSFIIRSITADGTIYLFAIALLMYGLVFRGLNCLSLNFPIDSQTNKYCSDKNILQCSNRNLYFEVFLFLTLGFYFRSFNMIRQFIAMGFSLNAFYYAKEKKVIPYILLVVFGTLFHTSCLVTLTYLLFFIKPLNVKERVVKMAVKTGSEKIVYKFFFPLLVLLLILVCFIFILPLFFNLAVSIFFPSYLGYLESEYMGQSAGVHTFLVSLAILIAYYLFSADNYKERRINIFVMLCGVAFNSLAFSFALMTRISCYYQIVEINILASLLTNNVLKGYKKPVFTVVVFICCIMYYSLLLLFSGVEGARNYFFRCF